MNIVDISETLPWNTNGDKWRTRKESKIKRVVVHQALGTKTALDTNKFCITNSPDMAQGRGMPRIAYHYFIEPDGMIYKCNARTAITSHVANMNTECLGVCLGGFYDYENTKGRDGNPPEVQLKSLGELLVFLTSKLGLPKTAVYTHDELQGKPSCPGITAAAFVKTFRNQA
jgi:hypothetical protein